MAKKVAQKKAEKKSGAQKAPKTPKAARPPKSAKTVAETGKKAKGGTVHAGLSEKLEKPFALVTCKRLVALAEEHNLSASKLANLKETLKVRRTSLSDGSIDTASAKTIALQLYREEEESDNLKQRIKAVSVDTLRLIMEACGGTLFEFAATVKEQEGGDELFGGTEPIPRKQDGVKRTETVLPPQDSHNPSALSPVALLTAQTIVDDRGQEVSLLVSGGPIVGGSCALSWWAHESTPAWAGKTRSKVGQMIRSLEEVGCGSPSLLLKNMREWWTNAKDRKQAIEALPDYKYHDLWSGVREVLTAAAERDTDGQAGVRDAIVAVAKANVEAWIDFCKGPDSALNKIRVAHEL